MNENPYTPEESQNETEHNATEQAPQPKRIIKVSAAHTESGSKKFWRVVFGSALGFLLVNIISAIFGILVLLGIIGSLASSESTSVPNNAILSLTLNAPIQERKVDNPLEEFNMGSYNTTTIGLDELRRVIKEAAKDDKIRGISLNLNWVQAGTATISEIRDLLIDFKQSGKFIYAYSENYTQGSYYLASTADSIFLNPQGLVDIKGLALQNLFFKGLIDKLDVDVQVVKCGKYKSAVEPYLMDKMSAENREQSSLLAQSIWDKIKKDIACSRHIAPEQLDKIANELLISETEDAKTFNLVDHICYQNEYYKGLKSKLGIGEEEKLNLVSYNTYKKSLTESLPISISNSDKIAVIYAYGNIIDGKGEVGTIGSETLCREIKKAYSDASVKAIVLRVNSPGGSALASDIIWNELEMAKANGKKLVTSMGDYAASGGYYISCNSDFIVAQPNTITGSIGVFGLIPSFGETMKNKLGITIDVVKTHNHSDASSGFRTLTEEEYNHLQKNVDQVYTTFLTRVAEGRDKTIFEVDEIGQGRVWTGTDALKLGLVDQLGTLDDAIAVAANLAQLKEYEIAYYPQKQSWFEQILKDQQQDVYSLVRNEMGDLYPAYESVRQLTTMKGIQARMPMEIKIEL